MAKQPVRVHIFNQPYTLLADGDSAEVQRAADEIDQLMTTISQKTSSPDSTRVAVLACLHLADRLHAAERKLKGYEDRSERIAGLLRTTLAS
jgi:cell division protein ZapA